MAKILMDGNEVEVPDGEAIKEAARSLGIPFSCEDGTCGTCLINVLEGRENLGDLNEREKDFGLTDNCQRLACQCKIKEGETKIESGY